MNFRYKNQSALTLVELLVVMAIGVILMGATIQVFVKQEKILRDQNSKTNLRALGRIAIEEIAMEIRRAGYGFPPGEGILDADDDGTIEAADASSIWLRGNTENVITTLSDDSASGDGDIDVWDDTGFADNDTIVIMDPTAAGVAGGRFETETVDGTPSSDEIDLDGTTDRAYDVEDGVVVSQYHTTIFAYDAGNNRITKSFDGTVFPVIGNVAGLAFTYRDSAGATTTTMADVRSIEIQITLNEVTGNSTVTVTFNTDVQLRNMGT